MDNFTRTELIILQCLATWRAALLAGPIAEAAYARDKSEAGSDDHRKWAETYRSNINYQVELQHLAVKLDCMLDATQA